MDTMLQNRLTMQAADELEKLHLLLMTVELGDTPDDRTRAFAKEGGKLAVGMIYKAFVRGDQKLPSFDFIWCNFTPPRVKFFG